MSNYFTEDDQRLLDKTIHVRERLVDKLIESEVPTKTNDVLSLISVIESLDKTILAKAKLKIEDTDSKNNEATQEVMRELMINLHRQSTIMSKQITNNIAPEFKESDMYLVTDSEIIKYVDNVTIDDFT